MKIMLRKHKKRNRRGKLEQDKSEQVTEELIEVMVMRMKKKAKLRRIRKKDC